MQSLPHRAFYFLILFILSLGLSAQTPKVLLIGIDGCRPDALIAADTPAMDALAANGTFSYDALNTGITISGPGWGSLLTGVWPEKHGITDNGFGGSNLSQYPHLFQRIEEVRPELQTESICQWAPINNSIELDDGDYRENVADETQFVVDAAVARLENADPDILFLHLDDVDHAGHGSGFSPDDPNYIAAIEEVDGGVGQVMAAIEARPSFSQEDWLIVVSTDHGGLGTSHGGNSIEERNIFMIVSGAQIPNEEIAAPETLVEIPPVDNCLNSSDELLFDGTDDVAVTSQSSAFDFGSAQDFTVECRVRTTTSGDFAILTDKDWDSGALPGWVFSFNVSGGPWKVNVGDGGDRVDVEGSDISDGEWHTLAATFDRDGMLTIYEDGSQVGQSSMAAIGDINTGFPISFGADAESDYHYPGYLSEVRIFNGLVSPAALDAWQCQSIDASHPSFSDLIGYWRMDEGAGSTLIDSSPTQSDGGIVGAAWQDAARSTFETVKDYSSTPRQVDFILPALDHLCIAVDPEWDLDGGLFTQKCTIDLDADGAIDVSDFLIYNSAFGQSCGCCKADFNKDGLVDVNDFVLFNSAFGGVSVCD